MTPPFGQRLGRSPFVEDRDGPVELELGAFVHAPEVTGVAHPISFVEGNEALNSVEEVLAELDELPVAQAVLSVIVALRSIDGDEGLHASRTERLDSRQAQVGRDDPLNAALGLPVRVLRVQVAVGIERIVLVVLVGGDDCEIVLICASLCVSTDGAIIPGQRGQGNS